MQGVDIPASGNTPLKAEVEHTLLVVAQMRKLRLDRPSALPQASAHGRGGCSLLRYMLPHAPSGIRQQVHTPRHVGPTKMCFSSGVSGIVQEGPSEALHHMLLGRVRRSGCHQASEGGRAHLR